MREWAVSLRLPICILSGILVIISFKISNLNSEQSWLCAVSVFAIASATMVHNDWRDRFNDVKKGKQLAHDSPKKFFAFTVLMWAIAFCLSLLVTMQNWQFSILLWLMILAGLTYSETRMIPFAPISIVSITSASPALFPVFLNHSLIQCWLLFAVAVITIFGREILKDLQDFHADCGYKWTLPQKIGFRWSEIIAGVAIFTGFVIIALISKRAVPGLFFSLVVIFYLLKSRYVTSKSILDLGIIIALSMIWTS